jgi:adenylosuccinate synthase
MPATVIVGAQWGDEGKGKIVDLLACHSDVVCRYQGGPNAGHTIVAGGETFKLHHIPSGILYPGVECVLGAGCVIDPEELVRELDGLEERGVSTERVHVSGNAHMIMPWHLALDRASERRLGALQIGTTRRGIGPAYADKAARLGIRVQDLLDPKILRQKIEVALAEKNVWLAQVYGAAPLELDGVAESLERHAQRLRPYVADTSLLVDRAVGAGRTVLLEGAQGTLLDLDHGTYPFVTSSNPVAGAAATGVGIGPNRIDAVIGVAKAYLTRVGEGPFPTEIQGPDQARMRELGQEVGTTTGRERRCGWLDLVALRYAARLNGFTSLALTKLDVLSHFREIPVCTRYRLRDGSVTEEFPAHQSDFHHCRPVYEVRPGWEKSLAGAETLDDLPVAARGYIDFLEAELGVEVSLVGTGRERESVLSTEGLAALVDGRRAGPAGRVSARRDRKRAPKASSAR